MTQVRYIRRAAARQRLIAAGCIAALSMMYLAGYAAVHRVVVSPERTVASAQLATLAPPVEPEMLAYAPDVPPPEPSEGIAPVLYTVPTKQPVVFLTIDDGVYQGSEAAPTLAAAHIPASLFLTHQYVARAPEYFRHTAQQTRSVIENHTLAHKDLAVLSREDQRREVCGASEAFTRLYGQQPQLFRPPYGSFTITTQRVVAECGMRAVVMWSALVEHGAMHYQVGDTLRPGDIVLMHFTPSFAQDVAAFAAASKASGLQPQLLEDWFVP